MMKKELCFLITLLLLLLCAMGCAAEAGETAITVTPPTDETEVMEASDSTTTAEPHEGGDEPLAPGTSSATPDTTTATPDTSTAATTTTYYTTTVAMTSAAAAEPSAKTDGTVRWDDMLPPPDPSAPPQENITAGMLTAGEWRDLDDIPFWQKLLRDNEWFALMERRHLFPNSIVPVRVTDADGTPCLHVPVLLKNADGEVIYRAVTDVDGMAYLLYDLDGLGETAAHVHVGGTDHAIAAEGVTEIKLTETAGAVEQLDVLFMIDTTGSMSDELMYLQTELHDVIRRIAQTDDAYSIRLSVNFYRDTGDEYVVRSFAFTGDIELAIAQLREQVAAGGGDYPEAVHNALKDVVANHTWREDAVKLCFMVLDAPPHSEQEIRGIDGDLRTIVLDMAAQGIRFLPVASSGVDTETEFLLRSWAVMTGGTYVFLTNHSGIGNDHLEPTVGAYEVERLNDLLVRVILEYCGRAQ